MAWPAMNAYELVDHAKSVLVAMSELLDHWDEADRDVASDAMYCADLARVAESLLAEYLARPETPARKESPDAAEPR